MLDKYKEEYQKIEVPTSLKEQTLQKMNAVTKKKRNFFFPMKTILTLGICAVVGIGFIFINKSKDSILDTVNVSNGKLVFEKQNSKNEYFSNINQYLQKEVTVKEFEKELQKNVPDLKIRNFKIVKEQAFVHYDQNWHPKTGDIRVSYEKEQEKISLKIQDKKLDFKANSFLGDVPIDIIYKQQEDTITFIAMFSIDDMLYRMETTNVSQEDFVKILENFID